MSSSEELAAEDDYEQTQLGPKTRRLPAHWEVRKLGAVAGINMGSSPKSEYYNEQGEGLPFFQGNADFGAQHPQVTVWCTNPNKTADEGDLLLSVRAPVGDLNIATQHCCIGRGLAAVSGEEADTVFLYYLLEFERQRLGTYAQGSTFESVNSGVLNKFPIQFPSLPEQRRIADILSTIDEQIQQTDDIIRKTEELKSAVANRLFVDGLRDKEQEPVKLGPKSVSLPRDWNVTKLTNLKSPEDNAVQTGPYQLGDVEFRDSGLRVYGQSNVTSDDYTSVSNHISPDLEGDFLRYKIQPGDVLLTRMGTVGDASLFPDHAQPGILSYHLLRIRPEQDSCWSPYLHHLLNDSKLVMDQIRSLSHGSIMDGLNVSTLRQVKVPLPPLPEQKRIGMVLDKFDRKMSLETQSKEELQELKRGLMQDLLTGKVRVTPDD